MKSMVAFIAIFALLVLVQADSGESNPPKNNGSNSGETQGLNPVSNGVNKTKEMAKENPKNGSNIEENQVSNGVNKTKETEKENPKNGPNSGNNQESNPVTNGADKDKDMAEENTKKGSNSENNQGINPVSNGSNKSEEKQKNIFLGILSQFGSDAENAAAQIINAFGGWI